MNTEKDLLTNRHNIGDQLTKLETIFKSHMEVKNKLLRAREAEIKELNLIIENLKHSAEETHSVISCHVAEINSLWRIITQLKQNQ